MATSKLTKQEREVLHNCERLTSKVWKVVAKDQGCTWSEYQNVPYHLRLADFQTAIERNPL